MLATQLIVLDGLPGSGKTTTAEWLNQELKERGIKTWYLPEYDTAHPLWWYDYWDGTDYHTPDFDHIPIESCISNSLSRWRDFSSSLLQTTDRILVIAESVFFMNAVGMLLMGGADPARLLRYAREVRQIVRDLDPILIYFRQNDASTALHRICALRGLEFEQELLANMERFPYLKHRKLTGLKGVTVLWQDIQQLTDVLYLEYDFRKLALETSEGKWAEYRQHILQFLGIDPLH